jgi:WD40 repeat protein
MAKTSLLTRRRFLLLTEKDHYGSSKAATLSSDPGTLLARHLISFEQQQTLPYSLIWTPDSRLLAALAVAGNDVGNAGNAHLIYLWEGIGSIRFVYQARPTNGAALAWVPGSQHLSFLEGSTQIVAPLLALWNVTTGHKDDELVAQSAAPSDAGVPSPLYALAWSPDGRKVAFADSTEVTVYDQASHRALVSYPPQLPAGGQPSYIVAWSPDGKTIVSAGHTHAVQFWEAATGQPLHYFPEQTKAIAAAWSADGKALAYLAGPVS